MARPKNVKAIYVKEEIGGVRIVVRFDHNGIGYVAETLDKAGVSQYTTLYKEETAEVIYAERWERDLGGCQDGSINAQLYEMMEWALDIAYEKIGGGVQAS